MTEELSRATENLDAKEIISYLNISYGADAVFSTSFGIEDQVVTHLIQEVGRNIAIFTLETGRLFPETYKVWSRTVEKYDLPIRAYYPLTEKVENLLSTKGPSSFYNSVEDRKECCYIRKIEPLHRAIRGYKIWITGIRAEQSPNREDMRAVEYDAANNILKIHPLFHWTLAEVEDYIKTHQVPYNLLHDKGFPSIGCQPCTRAIAPGEDFRAGRWWWEDTSKKECGLHRTTN
jgi:phosphoadenosine phosphosulfate reductase